MADYAPKRAQAVKLIARYGVAAQLTLTVRSDCQTSSWKPDTTQRKIPVTVVMFADDGETFVDHNITGNVQIALIAPTPELTALNIGDTITLPHSTVKVEKVKALDPDTSGAILWTALVK